MGWLMVYGFGLCFCMVVSVLLWSVIPPSRSLTIVNVMLDILVSELRSPLDEV